MEFIRRDMLRRYRLKPEDLTVTFDSVHAEATFTAFSGCDIQRDENGIYHCSRDEWENMRGRLGVKLIEEIEW